MHPQDLKSFQQQTGLRNPDQDVIDEYEIVATMLSRDGQPLPIRSVAMANLLRRLGYKPPTIDRPSEFVNVDWARVPQGAPVVCKKDPANPRSGVVVGSRGGGMVAVRLDGDTAVRSIGQRYLELAVVDNSDPWKSVKADTPVVVTINNTERDAKFIDVLDKDNVRVLLKSGIRTVAKADTKLTSLATA
jgi:hypothetical protein